MINISSNNRDGSFQCLCWIVFLKSILYSERCRQVNLITPNASGLHAKYGFRPASHPEECIERNTSMKSKGMQIILTEKRTNR